jgi:hypothetical protein
MLALMEKTIEAAHHLGFMISSEEVDALRIFDFEEN